MRNEDIVPSLATEEVADDELEEVKRDVGYNAVYPDHTGPSPSDSTDPCKAPVCVDSKYSGNLQRNAISQSLQVVRQMYYTNENIFLLI